MNDEKPGAAQFFRYLSEKKSLWLIAAALLLGIGLMLAGGRESAAPTDAAAMPDASALEMQVRRLCEGVIGSTDVCVAITLDTYGEQRYAADSQTSADGSRTETRTEYVTASQGLTPTQSIAPRVRGAAVVCARGDEPAVQLKLVMLLTALFDIPADAVCVMGAAE